VELFRHFPDLYLVIAAVLYMFAQALQMGTGAARLAGVRTKRVATGLTLFNLFATTGRLLNLFYAPLLSSMTDHARKMHDIAGFDGSMRLVMIAATLGAVLGGALIPWSVKILQRGIGAFERSGSLVTALSRLAAPSVLTWVFSEFRLPTVSTFKHSAKSLPKSFLIWNVVVTAFWVAGPLAALYASVIAPDVTATCIALSGLITGVATITLTLIVDPAAALITDQAALGQRPEADVKAMLLYLVITAIIGTLLSQLLLDPAAGVIAYVARFLYDHGFHQN
jgi:hypothetical protein